MRTGVIQLSEAPAQLSGSSAMATEQISDPVTPKLTKVAYASGDRVTCTNEEEWGVRVNHCRHGQCAAGYWRRRAHHQIHVQVALVHAHGAERGRRREKGNEHRAEEHDSGGSSCACKTSLSHV